MTENAEEWGVIFPKYMDEGEPDWLMICEDQGHATRVYVGIKGFGVKVKLVYRERRGWSEV